MQQSNPWFDEVIETHVLIQHWLGNPAPEKEIGERLIARFSKIYSMVGIAGKALDYAALCSFFHANGGAKQGLEIEVFDLRMINEWQHGAVVQYQERQTLAGSETLRYSTVVLERTRPGEILWLHLHETRAET